MAKEIAAQVGAWKKVEATVEQTDTGDILTPLRRIQTQYLNRAFTVNARGVSSVEPDKRNERRPNGHTKRPLPVKYNPVRFYENAAVNIGRLLGDSLALTVQS